MLVPYTKFVSLVPTFKAFWRPMLDVKFYYNAKSFRSIGLVDSGADQILLNKDYAYLLDLQWDAGIKSKTVGINGTLEEVFLHDIEIEVINLPKSRRSVLVGFADLPIDTLLGQFGFFENYYLKFRYDLKSFDIEVITKHR
jgi:hypothetical protein